METLMIIRAPTYPGDPTPNTWVLNTATTFIFIKYNGNIYSPEPSLSYTALCISYLANLTLLFIVVEYLTTNTTSL